MNVGLDTSLRDYPTKVFDFLDKRFDVCGNQRLLPGVGVEVAIGAAVSAKWDVEVERG
jgi:hypothetical protein